MDHATYNAFSQWAQETLRDAVRTGTQGVTTDDVDVVALQIPPEELEYLRQLIQGIIHGREVVSSYNYIVSAVVAVFTGLHALEKWRCRRKRWSRQQQRAKDSSSRPSSHDSSDDSDDTSSTPSSSSSSPGVGTPSGAAKDFDVDVERLPLLGLRQQQQQQQQRGKGGVLTRTARKLSAWLQHQPSPLPVVDRALPSNGTSLFVALWLATNIFLALYQMPLGLKYFFCFADRAGYIFIVNLPLLYLLAAKNNPLNLLTGRSYEALNIFHRRVGEFMCLAALAHSLGMVVWRFALEPAWLHRGGVLEYLTHPLVLFGIGALASYELLYLTSLGGFRRRWYEIFLASHVVLQIVALACLYLHFYTARPYVLAALAVFAVDRLVWRLALKSTTTTAEIEVLPDGHTMRLTVRPSASLSGWWRRRNVSHGWNPTDHVFLTAPTLGRSHALQAHPFTIASPPPSCSMDDSPELALLIRAHGGFTADLLRYAHQHRSLRVRLDGPYGSGSAMDMLTAADDVVLVAGGSGIAVTLPMAWALLGEGGRRDAGKGDGCGVVSSSGRRRAVRMLWIIHSEDHRSWAPGRELDELIAAGLELVVPPPTAVAGRPDVVGIVGGWIEAEERLGRAAGLETAVVVSGPDGLNRAVRNACAEAVGRGIGVRLAVEKFGW